MGSNNNKKTTSTTAAPPANPGYGPNPGTSSSSDPKGRMQNQIGYQQQRYESQQGPVADSMAYNYGRGTESDYGNYTDIMNNYRDIASGGGSGGGGGYGGGGGGGGGYTPQYNAYTVDPERVGARTAGPIERVKASDPFESYKGFQEFGQTGGYSGSDIADLRARGVAPIRAAYANAERNIGQQRGLQGGYSPNAIAAQVKMAREQGQGMADANQDVNAKIVNDRNQGRLAGYTGMAGIEGQRLGAQMQGDIFNAGQYNQGEQFNAGQENDVGKFNADLGFRGQTYNADAYTNAEARNNAAAESAAARGAAASAQNNDDRLRALAGMSNLYGTTPGMSNMFGTQVSNIVGQGGTMGLGFINAEGNAGQQTGAYDQTKNRINDALGYAQTGANIGSAFLNNRNQANKGLAPSNLPTLQKPANPYNQYGYSSPSIPSAAPSPYEQYF